VVYIAREAASGCILKSWSPSHGRGDIRSIHGAPQRTHSARPGGWLSVLFDVPKAWFGMGVKNVLILNGHGGNTPAGDGDHRSDEVLLKNPTPPGDLQFCSYWEFDSPGNFLLKQWKRIVIPGHAQGVETAIDWALFPENVRKGSWRNGGQRPPAGHRRKGRTLRGKAVRQTV